MLKIIGIAVACCLGSALTVLCLIGMQLDIANLFGITEISLLKDLITPLAASFGGAISGALAAFGLQKKEKTAENKQNENGLLLKTFFILKSHLDHLFTIKKQCISPYAALPVRFLTIRPFTGKNNIDSIDFSIVPPLTRLNKIDLIEGIQLAERYYFDSLDGLEKRSLQFIKVQELLKSKNVNNTDSITLNDLIKNIGINEISVLYEITEGCIDLIDEGMAMLKSSMDELILIMQNEYESKIKFDIKEENQPVFEKTIPPAIQNLEHLFVLSGHKKRNL